MQADLDYQGDFSEKKNPEWSDIQAWIKELERTPRLLREFVEGLSEEQLSSSYRPGGWTVRQVVHHIADNNMNAFFRFKRALTEDQPIIPGYRQNDWAQLADYEEQAEVSLRIIESIYRRFLALVKSLPYEAFKRTLNSEAFGVMSLETALQRFLWHDRHHLAQIERIRKD